MMKLFLRRGYCVFLTGALLLSCAGCRVFQEQKTTTARTDVEVTSNVKEITASEEEPDESSETETSAAENQSVEQQLLCRDQNHHYDFRKNAFNQQEQQELDENVTASYVVLYDAAADEILYSREGQKRIYPASTTKMLTAITACKLIGDAQTVLTVGDEIYMIDPESSVAGLEVGMKLTLEMMLDALLMPSGNDAAYSLAVNAARLWKDDPELPADEAIAVFMQAENEIAQNIGAKDTHFVTPDGIHDEEHYTTAEDLVRIADYARKNPLILSSCGKAYVEWRLIEGGDIVFYNSNKLLSEEYEHYSPDVDGMKTGFTDQAGTCVVSSATIDGHTMIAAVMDADTLYTKYEDSNLLFKKGFALAGLTYRHE